MIKTRIDDAITEYIQALLTKEEMSEEDTQRLLDKSREALNVDSIYISEMMTDSIGHVFTHMSVRLEMFDLTGQQILLSRDEFNEMISNFDEDGFLHVEDEHLKDDYSGRNLCYGIKRGQQYEAFIGLYVMDVNRVWTEEEKFAVKKLGRAFSRVIESARFASQNEQRVRDTVIYDYLLWEYDIICFVDLEKDSYSIFRQSKYAGIRMPAGEKYSAIIKRLLPRIDAEYRDLWNDFADRKSLIRMFATEDRREFVYKMSNLGNPWRRILLQVAERKDGDVTKLLVSVMGIDNLRAERIELMKTIEDQNRELEIEKNRAEEANAAKRQFLFNMSHDIRTPMNAILGFTSMALDNIEDRGLLKECLQKVEISGEHLLQLINDVLDMSRIESGKTVISEAPMDVFECGRDLVTLVHEAANEKNIEIGCSSENIKHPVVWADALHIKRVALNIIGNAIKYTDNGGKVMLTLKEIPSEKPGYASFEFFVTDNGIGMNSAFLEHIYEPFSRENSSTKSGIEGTGLGMSIALNLVNLMGGKIEVLSEQGEGTTVVLRITLRIAEDLPSVQKSENKAKEFSKELAGKRVLLVDDNVLNREIAQHLLEHFGMEVFTADDGSVTVDMVKENSNYDIVLMDIQMPVMDGYEATREIRKLKTKASKIPIVAMTANAFAEDRELALKSGMNEHLGKPIDVELLKKVIARYVS